MKDIVCHVPGDRCAGCDHYHGKADKCIYDKWTKEPPTEPGWYWWRDEADGPAIVLVSEGVHVFWAEGPGFSGNADFLGGDDMSRCDTCNNELISPCLNCGAPICCPHCCYVATLEEFLNRIFEQASKNGEDVSYLLAKQAREYMRIQDPE